MEKNLVESNLIVQLSDLKTSFKNYNQKLNQLKYYFNNLNELIYDECCELRRIIQLNTEEYIVRIKEENDYDIDEDDELDPKTKELIEIASEKNQILIDKVDLYEKTITNDINTKSLNKIFINKEINQLKQISKYFINYWEENLFENFSKLDLIKKKLNKYHLRLNNVATKFKTQLFNNNLLEFKSTNLIGYLYFKQTINFNQLNRLNISKFIDESDILDKQFELFDSNSFLITFRKRSLNQTLIYKFNAINKTIENKVVYNNFRIHNLKKVNNLIVIVCSNEYYYNRDIAIMDANNLSIIRQKKVGSISLIGANESQLFCFEDININGRCNLCKVFDWNLNLIDMNIKFQQLNRLEPFYIPFETINISVWQFESIDDKYVVRSISDRTMLSYLIIYDHKGNLLQVVRAFKASYGLFRLDESNNIFVSDGADKLICFDLNGNLIKEIKLANKTRYFEDEYLFNFLIENDKFYFFNKTSIFFC